MAAVVALLVVAGAYGVSRLAGSSASGSTGAGGSPAWLGLQMGSLPSGAVVVTGVTSGGPAASAGLKVGDVVTEIESRPVGASVAVTEAVDALRAGDSVVIQVIRGSATYTMRVRLGSRPHGSP
jgi:S1-C subfamily serine protease